ncbi:MAG: hypothetical protein AAB019_10280 [Planctomycetota bacterium]
MQKRRVFTLVIVLTLVILTPFVLAVISGEMSVLVFIGLMFGSGSLGTFIMLLFRYLAEVPSSPKEKPFWSKNTILLIIGALGLLILFLIGCVGLVLLIERLDLQRIILK